MGRICDAINKGADTLEKVHKATGSGSGGCGATRCTPVILELLANGGKPLVQNLQRDDTLSDYEEDNS